MNVLTYSELNPVTSVISLFDDSSFSLTDDMLIYPRYLVRVVFSYILLSIITLSNVTLFFIYILLVVDKKNRQHRT